MVDAGSGARLTGAARMVQGVGGMHEACFMTLDYDIKGGLVNINAWITSGGRRRFTAFMGIVDGSPYLWIFTELPGAKLKTCVGALRDNLDALNSCRTPRCLMDAARRIASELGFSSSECRDAEVKGYYGFFTCGGGEAWD